jgi:L-malate glycosyltransferase
MKILTVNYEYPPLGGGGGVACEQVAAELVQLGHQVDVLTSMGQGTARDEVRDGVRIRRVEVWGRKNRQTASFLSMVTFIIAAVSAGRKLVKEQNYDIVHTHFAVPTGPAGVKIARAAGIPMMLSVHGGDLYDPSKRTSPHRFWPAGRVVRWVLNNADLVVAQSSNTARNARTHHHFDGRLEIVPLGIPPVEFAPATRADFGLEPNDFVLITVGRLVRRKGINTLLDALAGVESPNVKLIICGDGPERLNLEAQVRDLGLADRVSFVGHIADEQKFQMLSLADGLVMASLHEGFGIVFLEAMSQGLPILAANVGGQTDFLEDQKNALLVPPASPEPLRRGIERLLNDKPLRDTMRANNLAKIEQFSIRNIARQHVRLFEELISNRGAKA